MRDKKIKYSDDLEKILGDSLERAGIDFIHESQNNGSRLDFYLPKHGVYIEVKKFHTNRVIGQLESKENVILLQGKIAVKMFCTILDNRKFDGPIQWIR